MNLDLTRIFLKVAQNGSFSRAASILQLPKSTVSKAVAKLERETGTKLILRTTRSLTLTAAGRVFFDSALGPMQVIEDAQKSLYGADSILTGMVRLTAPEDLGSHLIAPAVAELTKAHAGLTFDLQYTDRLVDLVKEGFDFAVRIGPIAESSFKVRKVGEAELVTVAAPKYLKGVSKIREPLDLKEHCALAHDSQRLSAKWTLRAERSSVKVPLRIRATSNQMSSILRMALAGGGVAMVPHFLCQPEIEAGKLVRVLPAWAGETVTVSMISPLASSSSARLKISMEHVYRRLVERLIKE